LLENDLFLERFFRRHEASLTERNAIALQALMDLPDNDLLDILLGRNELQGLLDCVAVHEVLALIRTDPMTERY
jgi:antitoxin CptB